jgi:hypothetical protein
MGRSNAAPLRSRTPLPVLLNRVPHCFFHQTNPCHPEERLCAAAQLILVPHFMLKGIRYGCALADGVPQLACTAP